MSKKSQGVNSRERIHSKCIGLRKFPNQFGWVSSINHNGKSHYLGNYEKEEDAALAYDIKARELYGSDAKVNFPDVTVEEAVERFRVAKIERKMISKELLSRGKQGKSKNTTKASKYAGVILPRACKRWTTMIAHNGQKYRLGLHLTHNPECSIIQI